MEARLTGRGKAGSLFGLAMGFFAMSGGLGVALAGTIAAVYAAVELALRRQYQQTFKRAATQWFLWLILITFVAWVLLSSSWSGTQHGQVEALNVAGLLLICPFLAWAMASSGINQIATQRAMIAGLIYAVAVLAFEAINGYALNHAASPNLDPLEIERNLGRGTVVCLVFLWPVLTAVWWQTHNRKAWLGILALTAFVATRFGLDLNIVIFFVAGFAAFVTLKLPRFGIWTVATSSAIGIMFAPFLYVLLGKVAVHFAGAQGLGLSYARRVQMWEFASARIAENPFLGWGLGHASTFNKVIQYGGFEWSELQRHPHAAPLHLWLETGLVGAGLLAVLVAGSGYFAFKRFGNTPVSASALVGGLTVILLSWGFSYGMWQEWLWVCLASLIGLCEGLRKTEIHRIQETKQIIAIYESDDLL